MSANQRPQNTTPIQQSFRAERNLFLLNNKLATERVILYRAMHADTSQMRDWQSMCLMEMDVLAAQSAISKTQNSIRMWKAYELKNQIAHKVERHGFIKKRDNGEGPSGYGIKIQDEDAKMTVAPVHGESDETEVKTEKQSEERIVPVQDTSVDRTVKIEDQTEEPKTAVGDGPVDLGPDDVVIKTKEEDKDLHISVGVFATMVRSANLSSTQDGFTSTGEGRVSQAEPGALAFGLETFGNKVPSEAKIRKTDDVSEGHSDNRKGKRKAANQDGMAKRAKF
ncbi:hypothetical protein BJ875DRAFT_540339 [Amylocarpus encephaloides]|uniref:Uncharacterized protein n=1 Tax=Amylocarpus encephaloides TaxID=45428 RepID=A0A9P7YQH0_9HELO|nr:hypothetical protein BJ875DRAFT_540339 [Amylocarpus encephaloides]